MPVISWNFRIVIISVEMKPNISFHNCFLLNPLPASEAGEVLLGLPQLSLTNFRGWFSVL